VPDVTFDIDGEHVVVPEGQATLLAERLRMYSAGIHSSDVDELVRLGTDPVWLEGAHAMADAIEDALTATRGGPIPLDLNGRAANALLQILRLTPVTFADATTGYARLYSALTH